MSKPKGRALRTPAGGIDVTAYIDADLYRIEDAQGQTVGWMRKAVRNSWAIAVEREGPFSGTYADMPHAAQGILFRRREKV